MAIYVAIVSEHERKSRPYEASDNSHKKSKLVPLITIAKLAMRASVTFW